MCPYIGHERRDELDPLIEPLTLFPVEDPKTDGEVNYVITRIIDGVYGKGNYFILNRGIGVMDNVKDEFKRRRLFPYEDAKRLTEGDVFL